MTLKQKESLPKKKFRISSKKLFLTYSQVHTELSAQHLIGELQSKLPIIKEYTVGKEHLKDGGVHLHAVLKSNHKFDIRDANLLDISFRDNFYHGNYKAVRLYKNAVEYVCKDGDYITNLTNIKDGKFVSLEESLIDLYKQKGTAFTIDHYVNNFPKEAFGNKGVVNAKRLFGVLNTLDKAKKEGMRAPLSFHDFKLTPELQNWIDNGCQPSGLLVGPAGCGKTVFAKALAEHKQLKMLVVQHPDGLKDLNEDHDMVLFDDVHLDNMSTQQLLALFESNNASQIRVLYNVVDKKADLIQLFALNPDALKRLRHKISQPQFLRRLNIMPVSHDFIVNVSIHLHQHTHVYNNEIVIKRNKEILDSL